MPNLLQLLPEIEAEEMVFIQGLIKEYTDEQAQQFAMVYRTRRRDPQTILLTTLIGFLGVAGIQRFLTNKIGIGLLFLLTGGLCMIGTIVDLVSYRKIAFDYNKQQAHELSILMKGTA